MDEFISFPSKTGVHFFSLPSQMISQSSSAFFQFVDEGCADLRLAHIEFLYVLELFEWGQSRAAYRTGIDCEFREILALLEEGSPRTLYGRRPQVQDAEIIALLE